MYAHMKKQSKAFSDILILPSQSFPTPPGSTDTVSFPNINREQTLYTLDDDYTFEDNRDDEDHRPLEHIPDPEGDDDPDDGLAEEAEFTSRQGVFFFPPSLEDSEKAFEDLTNILRPPQNKGGGYKDPGLTREMMKCLEGVRTFLGTYIWLEKASPGKRGNWINASTYTVEMRFEKPHHARKLRKWGRSFIDNCKEQPGYNYGKGCKSALDDEDLAQDIHLHLQSLGKFVKAENIVEYCKHPNILERMKRTKTISLATARRWMAKMNYRWKRNHRGQYIDGHERQDVVDYRQQVFLPAMQKYEERS
ncbi:hypothetical protein C0992_007376 [Termitomyces sp. T32_za158]|nr:hypothetical protein C0992_007376 [Termitomyces sp. T32_za158]